MFEGNRAKQKKVKKPISESGIKAITCNSQGQRRWADTLTQGIYDDKGRIIKRIIVSFTSKTKSEIFLHGKTPVKDMIHFTPEGLKIPLKIRKVQMSAFLS